MKISIIIPVYNEAATIGNCLRSLQQQTIQDFEIIVVDDGSTDQTHAIIKDTKINHNLDLLLQKHQGPGKARNLGASKARGEILVFVDADMKFEPDFLEKLIVPIENGKAIGTFSKEEYLLNKENVWARYWNLNLGKDPLKMEPRDFGHKNSGIWGQITDLYKKFEQGKAEESRNESFQHVFRAILKSKFEKVGGFDTNVGYTDDWSLARKLNTLAVAAPGAKYYHQNPGSLSEVWRQARWFGKNEFLTKNLIRKTYNLLRYNPATGVFMGLVGALRFREMPFFIFKIIFNSAVFTSVTLSFVGEKKYK